MTRVYYDSCIFLHALNPENLEHHACNLVLDRTRISWVVCCSSELSISETNERDFIGYLLLEWATYGIDVVDVPFALAQREAQNHLQQKRALRLLGFTGRDFKHLMAAVTARAEMVCTADADFIDPKNKAGAKGLKVKAYIEANFAPLTVSSARKLCQSCGFE